VDDAEDRARAGRAIRDLGHAFVGREAAPELLADVASTLTALTALLDAGEHRDRATVRTSEEWKRGVSDAAGRLESYDDRPFSGRSSPWGVDLDVHRHGDEIEARCILRSAHEGAPGRSHGGIVAGLFDDVFGFVLDVVGEPAFTGELTIRFVGPTPLHRPIACRGRLAGRDGRKLYIEGELVDVETEGQPVVARGRSTFITVDPSVFAESTAKLPAPPDED
jgi:acyl-coenzyme A thioesterase PaaI-like protein